MRSALLVTLLVFSTLAMSLELPDGWRLPTEKELAEVSLRNESPTKNAQVTGDFNGDGLIDQAYLLKSTSYSGEGLAINLSSPNGYMWRIISKVNWGKEHPSLGLVMGIDLAEPTTYKTACSKGYWECGPNEPEILTLKYQGIWHYRFESAASIWYWNESINNFNQVWLSD